MNVVDLISRLLPTLGGDGGSIPKRAEQVRVKSKTALLDPSLVEQARWSSCQLTNAPLADPIVADAVRQYVLIVVCGVVPTLLSLTTRACLGWQSVQQRGAGSRIA